MLQPQQIDYANVGFKYRPTFYPLWCLGQLLLFVHAVPNSRSVEFEYFDPDQLKFTSTISVSIRPCNHYISTYMLHFRLHAICHEQVVGMQSTQSMHSKMSISLYVYRLLPVSWSTEHGPYFGRLGSEWIATHLNFKKPEKLQFAVIAPGKNLGVTITLNSAAIAVLDKFVIWLSTRPTCRL